MESVYLTLKDLARRWRRSLSSLRQAGRHELPPVFQPPGSRLLLFHIADVEKFERQHIHATPKPDWLKDIRSRIETINAKRGRPRKTRRSCDRSTEIPVLTKKPPSEGSGGVPITTP